MSIITQEIRDYVGARIREARGSESHDKLGKRCGLGRQHLIRLEQGRGLPRQETLEAIAKATGKPVDWFLPTIDKEKVA